VFRTISLALVQLGQVLCRVIGRQARNGCSACSLADMGWGSLWAVRGSAAFTHTLTGHRGGVWATSWSLNSEWILYSGGKDGAIRVWDVRRAGTLMVRLLTPNPITTVSHLLLW
jgi:WD40 repeat protein